MDEVEPEVSVTQPSADGDEQETNDEVKGKIVRIHQLHY